MMRHSKSGFLGLPTFVRLVRKLFVVDKPSSLLHVELSYGSLGFPDPQSSIAENLWLRNSQARSFSTIRI